MSSNQTSVNKQSDKVVKNRVAILGRPNVGKSTLFNIMSDSRKALVKNQPGVTRDIQSHNVEIWGHEFEIIDTGGLTEAEDEFSQLIQKQVRNFLPTVHLVILVMDGKLGLCPEDRDMVRLVKESGKDFLIVVNKIDRADEVELVLSEFYEFGVDLVGTSFERRWGLSEVFEWIFPRLAPDQELTENRGISMAVVGKPNAGKSSLCNYLLGEERFMVSDVAGTTIDAVDSQLVYKDRKYVLTDTAGLRRSAKRKDDVEILSAFKSEGAIKRSEIVLLMVDALSGPTEQDAKMLNLILEKHKGVILVINKTDLAKKELEEHRKNLRAKVKEEFHFFPDIPICFVSAKTGAGVDKMLDLVDEVWRKLHFRIPTSELNEFFTQVIRQAPAPVYGTKNVKFFYLTQTQQVPPSFIAFVNFPKGVDGAYRRFLTKQIRKRWGLEGIPIRIFAMKKGEKLS